MARKIRGVGLLGATLLAVLVPGVARAHLHQGHVVVGAAAIAPGPSGWSTLALAASEGGSLGDSGMVLVDGEPFEVECVEITDEPGGLGTPTTHFVKVGWRDPDGIYQLWLRTDTAATSDFFEVFVMDDVESACDRGSAGGHAIGTEHFLVGP